MRRLKVFILLFTICLCMCLVGCQNKAQEGEHEMQTYEQAWQIMQEHRYMGTSLRKGDGITYMFYADNTGDTNVVIFKDLKENTIHIFVGTPIDEIEEDVYVRN